MQPHHGQELKATVTGFSVPSFSGTLQLCSHKASSHTLWPIHEYLQSNDYTQNRKLKCFLRQVHIFFGGKVKGFVPASLGSLSSQGERAPTTGMRRPQTALQAMLEMLDWREKEILVTLLTRLSSYQERLLCFTGIGQFKLELGISASSMYVHIRIIR